MLPPPHHLLRVGALAHEDLSVAADGEAPGRTLGEQLALGRLRRARHHTQLGVLAEALDVRDRALAHARRQLHLRGRPRRRHLRVAERLFQTAKRVAQLVAAEHLADARAVRLANRLGHDVEVDRDVASHRGQALGHARVLGVGEVLFFDRNSPIGTPTPDPRPYITVTAMGSDTAAVQYQWRQGQEPACCPTGIGTVRFKIAHGKLKALDPIPHG